MEIKKGLHLFLWSDPAQNNSNTYLLLGKRKILIDPGHFHLFGHVINQLDILRLEINDIDLVLVTHFHPDHMEAVQRLKEGTFLGIHEEEYRFLRQILNETRMPFDKDFHILLKDGQITVGDISLEIIHTPGHSPGHMCIYWPKHKALFSGDLLFFNGIGRTDIIGGDPDQLKESLRRIEELDTEILLPGHGPPVIGRQECERNLRWAKEALSLYL